MLVPVTTDVSAAMDSSPDCVSTPTPWDTVSAGPLQAAEVQRLAQFLPLGLPFQAGQRFSPVNDTSRSVLLCLALHIRCACRESLFLRFHGDEGLDMVSIPE